jgi:succinoglycan biosynthesis protein ExoA
METGRLPFVSIVMPVRNEADFVGRALNSVLSNDYPAELIEVLVADGMSTDGTQEVVRQVASADARVQLVENRGKIVSTGLNEALRRSRGDVFIRVDGHCEVPSGFIRDSVEALFSQPKAWVAGGGWKTVSTGIVGRTIAAATQSRVGVGGAKHRLGGYDGWVDTVPYGAHHRWVLDRVGFFDEQLVRNQDDEFNMRIRLAGGGIWMSQSIRTTYYARSTLGKLWRQYFQYGFWRIRTIQKHGRPATFRQMIPLALVLSVTLPAVGGLFWSISWWVLAVVAVAYGLVLAYGSTEVLQQRGAVAALLAPIVFISLHFGYGLGSLWGIVRFVLLRGWGLPRPEEHRLSR